MISHDIELLEQPSTGCFHLDANRAVLDIYNVGWKATSSSVRPTSAGGDVSGRTLRSRPSALRDQAERMRAKATKAKAAQCMLTPR